MVVASLFLSICSGKSEAHNPVSGALRVFRLAIKNPQSAGVSRPLPYYSRTDNRETGEHQWLHVHKTSKAGGTRS